MEQVRVIERIRIHEGYNKTWLNNDIALAKLDRSFDLNYAVSPVCLPDPLVCNDQVRILKKVLYLLRSHKNSAFFFFCDV